MSNNNNNIKIEIISEPFGDEDEDSIGGCEDLKEILDDTRLGFNLPSNDYSKSGTLDDISVDSYWVAEEEIKEAEQEKKLDPANPNLKKICTKVQQKYAESTQQEQQEESRNKQEKSNEI